MFDPLPPALDAAALRQAFVSPLDYLAATQGLKQGGWRFGDGAWRRAAGETPAAMAADVAIVADVSGAPQSPAAMVDHDALAAPP